MLLARPGAVACSRHAAAGARASPVVQRPFQLLQHRCRYDQLMRFSVEGSARGRAVTAGAAVGGGAGGSAGSGGPGGGGGSGGSEGSSGEPHPLRNWTFLYAAFLAAGGVMAFLKAGSTKSLTTAGGSALILALSARKMVGATARINLGVACAIAALLSIVMCSRYARTRKLMPAGITAAASVGMTAAYLNGLFQ